MDKLYLDANVIIDYLQKRPNVEYVQNILLLAHKNQVTLITSVLNFATIFYLEKRRGHTKKRILDRFRLINKIISAVDQTAKSYQSALDANFSDFEDALQYFAAVENRSNYFITSNKKDYKNSVIPVLSAKEYLLEKL